MRAWVVWVLTRCFRVLRQIVQRLHRPTRRRGPHTCAQSSPRKTFAQPKLTWVRDEIIRLKALMPEAGCRTIAHHFNRRWKSRRQMTVSKTYVADTCRRHQYLIYEARRRLKHRVPRPMPRNWI